MDFRRLHTFRTVAALRSFSKAASILYCSQSTVSTQIKTLEAELETMLFHREGTNISLTQAGETYLAYANKLLSIQDEARAKVRELPDPPMTLSLRMPQSLSEFFLPGILERFQERFPQVGLDVSNCAFAELHTELKTGVTDVAFLLADSITREDLRVQYLADIRLAFIASPDLRIPQNEPFGLEELASCRLFIPKHDCSYRMRLKQELLERDLKPQSVVECNSMAMLKKCVARGLGVALVPEWAIREEQRRGELDILPRPSLTMETGLLMILHKDKWLSRELGSFLAICREEMAAPIS